MLLTVKFSLWPELSTSCAANCQKFNFRCAALWARAAMPQMRMPGPPLRISHLYSDVVQRPFDGGGVAKVHAVLLRWRLLLQWRGLRRGADLLQHRGGRPGALVGLAHIAKMGRWFELCGDSVQD